MNVQKFTLFSDNRDHGQALQTLEAAATEAEARETDLSQQLAALQEAVGKMAAVRNLSVGKLPGAMESSEQLPGTVASELPGVTLPGVTLPGVTLPGATEQSEMGAPSKDTWEAS